MYKVDLHTHSVASPDGSLRRGDYKRMLGAGLHSIAITDHNRIEFALKMQRELGDDIIVGEEIATTEGELVGLFLNDLIPAGLSARETAKRIKDQQGLVYIPHPFETVRQGVALDTLDSIADLVDIIEVANGRALFQNRGLKASDWAQKHGTAMAASSDAHGWRGWGKTYSVTTEPPTRTSLVQLLKAAYRSERSVGLGVLYPKLNRLRKAGRQ
jgi:predicted metal-dependent phosphoesterase TrpH